MDRASKKKFAGNELPKKLDTDEYQILVAAKKNQNGYDEPKPVAVFVDKQLGVLQAVQTLSAARLTADCGFPLRLRAAAHPAQVGLRRTR